MSVSLRFPI